VELTAAQGGFKCACANGYEGDGVGPEGWGYRFTMNFLFPK
jgi:hypothetical protein